jgi:hypothetical protein
VFQQRRPADPQQCGDIDGADRLDFNDCGDNYGSRD